MIFNSNNYSHWYNHRILIGYIATSTNSILPVKSLYKLVAVDGAVGGSPLSRTVWVPLWIFQEIGQKND